MSRRGDFVLPEKCGPEEIKKLYAYVEDDPILQDIEKKDLIVRFRRLYAERVAENAIRSLEKQGLKRHAPST